MVVLQQLKATYMQLYPGVIIVIAYKKINGQETSKIIGHN